jgi:hypothetical protein
MGEIIFEVVFTHEISRFMTQNAIFSLSVPLMRELNRYLEFIALYGILLNCAHFI